MLVKRGIAALIAGFMLWTGVMAQAEALSAGDRGEEVEALQQRLIELNYLASGQADGIYGAKTQTALENFQQANGLAATGEADDVTLALLDSDQAKAALITLARGDEGEAVRALQESLIRYGFLDGEADGQFGPATQQAVKALQGVMKELGLEAGSDGKASPAMQTLLTAGGFSSYIKTLALDSSGDAVTRLQRRLIALNYMDEAADGHFGEYTQQCVEAFQKASGLEQTGQADQATYARLFAQDAAAASHPVPRDLFQGDSGRAVEAVQQRLIQWGFLAGLPDQDFDGDMVAALGRLQDYLSEEEEGGYLAATDALTAQEQSRLLDEDIQVYRYTVEYGTKGEQTYRVQRRLHSLYYLGYYQIDGKAGENTRDAIERFQELAGLEPTGVADEQTQQLLFSQDAPQDQTPYMLKVSIHRQRVYVYALDQDGQYQLLKEMVCSTGLGDSTPTGIYRKTGPQDRWHYFTKYLCWAQYSYIIDGDIMFHSVLYSTRSESSLKYSSVYNLGRKASHGCIRLSVEDAQWIFENCASRTIVVIDDDFDTL